MVKYTPELDLLLCCAHIYVDSQTQQRIRDLITENIDWQHLLQLGQQQKLLPLLYWHLNNCAASVPKKTLNELEQYFKNNARRNQSLTQEMFRLLDLFEQQKIPVLPYKGPSLALDTHGNMALRHWWDLDFVTNEEYFDQAKELLIQEKYYSDKQYGYEESFVQNETKISVDLHWQLTPGTLSFQYDFEHLWQRRKTLYVSEKRKLVSILTEDLLLMLCIQIIKDFYQDKIRLVQLCDLSELIRTHQEINWNEVIAQAGIMNCERQLFTCVLLVNELLGTVIPSTVKELIQEDSQIREYAIKFRNWVVSKPHSQKEVQDKIRQWHEELIDLFPVLPQLQQWKQELMNIVSVEQSFILVDQEAWRGTEILADLKAIPFLERDGEYAGLPADDANAIQELERLRQAGASYIIFASNAFWWLDYYTDFSQYLQSNFDCVFKSDYSIAFRLLKE